MPRHKLTITIDEETKQVSITHEHDGETTQTFLVESLALFGGNAQTQELFIQMYGASADAAWAYGRGFVQAHSPGGGKCLKNFYKQCACHVAQAIDPVAFKNEVAADALLNKWECQDQSKWFGWDTEDVLEDKQKSEHACKCAAEKKTWN